SRDRFVVALDDDFGMLWTKALGLKGDNPVVLAATIDEVTGVTHVAAGTTVPTDTGDHFVMDVLQDSDGSTVYSANWVVGAGVRVVKIAMDSEAVFAGGTAANLAGDGFGKLVLATFHWTDPLAVGQLQDVYGLNDGHDYTAVDLGAPF